MLNHKHDILTCHLSPVRSIHQHKQGHFVTIIPGYVDLITKQMKMNWLFLNIYVYNVNKSGTVCIIVVVVVE